MVAFHRNLRKGLPIAKALRGAIQILLLNPAYRHPFYWAPFVAMGAAALPNHQSR